MIQNTLGQAFARVNIYLKLAKIEFDFFKPQCKNQALNYEMGQGIRAIEKAVNQSKHILGKQAMDAMDNQLDEDRLMSISRIIQLLSHLDKDMLEHIESEFEKSITPQLEKSL